MSLLRTAGPYVLDPSALASQPCVCGVPTAIPIAPIRCTQSPHCALPANKLMDDWLTGEAIQIIDRLPEGDTGLHIECALYLKTSHFAPQKAYL